MWLASISEYPEELLAFLDRVLSINPDNTRAVDWRNATRTLLAKNFVQRAVAAREQQNDALATRCLDQAVEFDDKFAPAWFVRAAMAEDRDDKLEFLDRVLDLDPDHDDAKAAIAEIHADRSREAFDEAKQAAVEGDQPRALEVLDHFLDEVPDSVDAWLLKSHLSSGLEDKIYALEKALEIDPENAAARSGLAFLALTFGSSKESAPTQSNETPHSENEGDSDLEVEAAAYTEENRDEAGDAEPVSHDQGAQPETETEVSFASEAHDPEESDESPRSAEKMFGPAVAEVDAERETVESLSPFDQKVVDEIASSSAGESFEDAEYSEPEPVAATNACVFCSAENEPQALDCSGCGARLSLSDIEALISDRNVARDVIQDAVTRMEAEWNLRDFNEAEMTALALGQLNLGNLESGLRYLQEASRLNPNDVILSGQANALAIRLDEISRRMEFAEDRLTGKRILVVDDSPTVRKLISGKLEKSGHMVECASDGVEALEMIENSLPDLVLLDITMPRMDGYEVCKQIRSNPLAKNLPVVMISGKDGFFDKVRGRMAGSTGYVTKPFGPETLMKALETYLLPEA